VAALLRVELRPSERERETAGAVRQGGGKDIVAAVSAIYWSGWKKPVPPAALV